MCIRFQAYGRGAEEVEGSQPDSPEGQGATILLVEGGGAQRKARMNALPVTEQPVQAERLDALYQAGFTDVVSRPFSEEDLAAVVPDTLANWSILAAANSDP
ncbi:MAG: hypothetical protein PVF54_07530 [Anaerolineae bacterium]